MSGVALSMSCSQQHCRTDARKVRPSGFFASAGRSRSFTASEAEDPVVRGVDPEARAVDPLRAGRTVPIWAARAFPEANAIWEDTEDTICRRGPVAVYSKEDF